MNKSHSITTFHLLSFLGLPPEIRLMIYEFVFGVDQRIQIDCGLTKNKKTFGTFPVVCLQKFSNGGQSAKFVRHTVNHRSIRGTVVLAIAIAAESRKAPDIS